MPTYSRAEMLEQAIDSVLAQTEHDWELIVVDDGSPDPQKIPADQRIKLLRNSRSLGPAAARNRALSEAHGRYVAFLDDDDAWTSSRLENARNAHQAADVVVCAAGSLSTGESRARQWHRGQGPVHDWILDATCPSVGVTSVLRSLCPRFDEGYAAAEDLDWWLRLASGTDRISYLESADWLWRSHDGERHGIGSRRRLDGQFQLLRDHQGFFREHPRARAFRWRRIGLILLSLGDRKGAARAAARSVAAKPSLGALWLAIKTPFRKVNP